MKSDMEEHEVLCWSCHNILDPYDDIIHAIRIEGGCSVFICDKCKRREE